MRVSYEAVVRIASAMWDECAGDFNWNELPVVVPGRQKDVVAKLVDLLNNEGIEVDA